MFIERLKSKVKANEPIFTEELIELFSDFSRAQVFRYINKAKENGDIIQYDKGIYFIPKKTPFGLSSISADAIIRKKYLQNDNKVFGIYSGITLLNYFSITTQMAAVIEVVTNNESAKYREVGIKNRKFILRKARCTINNENVNAYMILQLFSEIEEDEISATAKESILTYIKRNKVNIKQITDLSKYFPGKAIKNLLRSEIIYGIA